MRELWEDVVRKYYTCESLFLYEDFDASSVYLGPLYRGLGENSLYGHFDRNSL